MVRIRRVLLKDAGHAIDKTLSEILVCPLSKQPLRVCEKTKSLVSDTIGVSFPIKDGIPCLVPKDGKILEDYFTGPSCDNSFKFEVVMGNNDVSN